MIKTYCKISKLYSSTALWLTLHATLHTLETETERLGAKTTQIHKHTCKVKRMRNELGLTVVCVPGWWQSMHPGKPCWPDTVCVAEAVRPYKQYTEQDRQRALDLVHKGASLRKAEAETGVPKTTLIRMTRVCKAHPGPCQGADIRAVVQLDCDALGNSDGTEAVMS